MASNLSDDGKGFEEEEAFTRKGLGLISMRERIQMVHRLFDIQTQSGAGTTIIALLSSVLRDSNP
jgi:signal transduction histidine kinase